MVRARGIQKIKKRRKRTYPKNTKLSQPIVVRSPGVFPKSKDIIPRTDVENTVKDHDNTPFCETQVAGMRSAGLLKVVDDSNANFAFEEKDGNVTESYNLDTPWKSTKFSVTDEVSIEYPVSFSTPNMDVDNDSF